MNFLYPLYFAGIFTAAVPVVIHLLTKRQKKHIVFSDLTLLREVDADEAPRYRWENLFLMLLRALVCVALAIVFTQPVYKSGGGMLHRPGQGTAAAIVLDASRSMGASEGGVSRYEKAKQMALSYLELLRGEDEAMVVFASSHSRVSPDAPTPFREEVMQAIEESEVTPFASSFSSAVLLAVEALLKSHMANKEIYLFTDCQKTAILPAPNVWPDRAETIVGYFGYLPDDLALPNVEIDNIQVTPLSAKPNDPITVSADIHSYGEGAPTSVEMHLQTGPNNRLYRNLTLVPEQSNPVQFSLSRSAEEVDLGFIELQADVLDSDNTARYALPIVRPIKILMTQGGGSEKTLMFFQLGLRFLAQAPMLPGIEAEYVPIQKIPETVRRELADVVVVANPGRVDREWVGALTDWIREGGSLVLAMGSVSRDQINSLMVPQWFPTAIQHWETRQKEPSRPTAFDFNHPWTDRFEKQEETNWRSVRIWSGYEFQDNNKIASTVHRLMTLDRGSPLLWQRDIGLGTLSVWMTSLDDKWNDVPRSGLYLALWGEFLRTLAEARGLSPAFTAGSQVPIEVIRKDDRPTEIHIVGPDEVTHVLAVAGPKLTQRLYFTRTERVGVYRIEYNEMKIERVTPSAFVVNVEPDEGNLTALPVEEVKKVFPFSIRRLDDRKTLAVQMLHLRHGYGLWPYVLALVICLLIAEAWVGRPT